MFRYYFLILFFLNCCSDVSNNGLCGTIPVDGPFRSFPMESFENNKLNGPELQGLVPYDFGC
ncbi:hypothetical protein CISIN_1g035473mg [Citrus sinensis]|uniref:Uncharacterized protein n=1 Tax=Citrus sinensis TaxID=2711 RepID=A0A067DCP1_CITSI|nr:hypothetical protein CISIN_1g035473mg [Citrus sinensis]